MSNCWQVGLCSALLVPLVPAGAGLASELSETVSPGRPTGSLVEGRCPTFSWSAVPGAESYEMIVYRIDEQAEEAQPILREVFSGSATSWTPSLDACLERGARYAWSVRSQEREELSDWSPPSLFEVASAPSELELEQALLVVREYLGKRAGAMASPGVGAANEANTSKGLKGTSSVRAVPGPLAAAAGDAALQVNGAAVVTTTSFGAGLCEALTYRYVDQGDGTVRDCHTGKIWLKDTSCLGTGTWGSAGTNGTVQRKVAQLNSGTQFNCSEYTPGTYTDWHVPAMTSICGLWNGSCTGTNCCTGSQGLVDTGFSSPAVANAAGDGKWRPEDAFVGVQSHSGPSPPAVGYWSATGAGGANAWGTFLSGGQVVAGPTNIAGYVWPVRSGL